MISVDDRLKRLRLLLFDVDGVLTDGGLWMNDDGTATKRFDIRDGAGIKMAQQAGLVVGFISGHESNATRHRAAGLGVRACHVGVKDKVIAARAILGESSLEFGQTLFMGDDLIDIPVMALVGVAATVPEAHPEVLRVAHVVSRAPGGRGAVREIIERVLAAQGRLEPHLGGSRHPQV